MYRSHSSQSQNLFRKRLLITIDELIADNVNGFEFLIYCNEAAFHAISTADIPANKGSSFSSVYSE